VFLYRILACKKIGNVPLNVANDGDVTALAGAIDLNDNKSRRIGQSVAAASLPQI
jgi:hypothetical protein